jgi:hypothetical protein
VIIADYSVVPEAIIVGQLVQAYVLTTGHGYFLLVGESGINGIVLLHNIKSTPQSNWCLIEVKKIMTPI